MTFDLLTSNQMVDLDLYDTIRYDTEIALENWQSGSLGNA